jgi:hypothetical protein
MNSPVWGGGRQDGDPSHPPLPPKMRIPPQNRRIWVKSAFSHVTVGPKVAEGPDVASHVTSADLGQSCHFPANS